MLQDLHIMEPDEIKRAVEYRKRKEMDETEGRQIQHQASQLVRRKIFTIIFFLFVIIVVIVAGYTHMRAWQSHHALE